eukprot:gene24402-29499_t
MFSGGAGLSPFPGGNAENYEDDLPLPPFQEVFAFILNNPLYQYKFGSNLSKKRGKQGGGFDGKAKRSKDERDIDETTGRWTAEEHSKFLEGVMRYGKDWKKMQPLIKTRSLVQIRTHAQKVFKKIGLSGMKKLSPQLTGDEGSTTTFMLGRLGGDAADIVGDDAAIPPSQDIAQAMESALGNVDNDEEPVHSGRNRGDDGSASPPPLAQTHKTVSFSDLCPSATSVDTAAATVVEKANVFPEPRNDPASHEEMERLYKQINEIKANMLVNSRAAASASSSNANATTATTSANKASDASGLAPGQVAQATPNASVAKPSPISIVSPSILPSSANTPTSATTPSNKPPGHTLPTHTQSIAHAHSNPSIRPPPAPKASRSRSRGATDKASPRSPRSPRSGNTLGNTHLSTTTPASALALASSAPAGNMFSMGVSAHNKLSSSSVTAQQPMTSAYYPHYQPPGVGSGMSAGIVYGAHLNSSNVNAGLNSSVSNANMHVSNASGHGHGHSHGHGQDVSSDDGEEGSEGDGDDDDPLFLLAKNYTQYLMGTGHSAGSASAGTGVPMQAGGMGMAGMGSGGMGNGGMGSGMGMQGMHYVDGGGHMLMGNTASHPYPSNDIYSMLGLEHDDQVTVQLLQTLQTFVSDQHGEGAGGGNMNTSMGMGHMNMQGMGGIGGYGEYYQQGHPNNNDLNEAFQMFLPNPMSPAPNSSNNPSNSNTSANPSSSNGNSTQSYGYMR